MNADLPLLLLRVLSAAAGIFLLWKVLRILFTPAVTGVTLLMVFAGTNLAGLILLTGPPDGLLRFDGYLILLWAGLKGQARFRWVPLILLVPAAVAAGIALPATPGWPHPVNLHRVLFSLQNGWLIYTPLTGLALAGLWYLAEKNIPLFYTAFLFLVIALGYAASSTRWNFPMHFGHPGLAEAWALLALPLACLVERIFRMTLVMRTLLLLLPAFLAGLNLFQTWQFSRSILVPGRMTGSYYAAVFGKCTVTDPERKLLIPASDVLSDSLPGWTGMKCRPLATYDFESPAGDRETYRLPEAARSGGYGMVMNTANAYSPGISLPLQELAAGDSAWLRVSGYFLFRCPPDALKASLVITCVHEGKPYKYRSADLAGAGFRRDRWNRVSMSYLLAQPAAPDDRLQAYFMNYGPEDFFLDDVEILFCQSGSSP